MAFLATDQWSIAAACPSRKHVICGQDQPKQHEGKFMLYLCPDSQRNSKENMLLAYAISAMISLLSGQLHGIPATISEEESSSQTSARSPASQRQQSQPLDRGTSGKALAPLESMASAHRCHTVEISTSQEVHAAVQESGIFITPQVGSACCPQQQALRGTV